MVRAVRPDHGVCAAHRRRALPLHRPAALRGATPYRDVFDNKGPLLYLINAFGLALGGGSYWGVYALEYVLLLVAAALAYLVLKVRVGRLVALLAVLFFVLEIVHVVAGDHEEEYEVVLQCVALFVLFRRPASEPRLRWWVVAGALGAGAFLLKPTGVGLWVALLAAVLVICARSGAWGTWLPRLAAVAGAAALVGACCFAYLSAMGALHSFIADYVSFNLMYSGQNGMADRLASAWYGAGQVGYLVVVAVVVAWLLTLRGVVRRSGQSDGADGLALLCVIWLPVEVVLAATSGYSRLQYYFLWLLPATMLLGCALARLSRSDVDEHATRRARPDRPRLGRLRSSWPAALLAAVAFAGLLAPTATLAHDSQGASCTTVATRRNGRRPSRSPPTSTGTPRPTTRSSCGEATTRPSTSSPSAARRPATPCSWRSTTPTTPSRASRSSCASSRPTPRR